MVPEPGDSRAPAAGARGAGRRGAPRGFPPLRGTRRALAFRVCAAWEKFGQKRTGVSGFVSAAPLVPSPCQPLRLGPYWTTTEPEERGVDPPPHVDMWGKESAPPHPQPLLCTDTPSEPRISGSGWLGQPLPPSPQFCPRPAPLALPSPVSAPLGGRGAPLGFPAQTECRVSRLVRSGPGQFSPRGQAESVFCLVKDSAVGKPKMGPICLDLCANLGTLTPSGQVLQISVCGAGLGGARRGGQAGSQLFASPQPKDFLLQGPGGPDAAGCAGRC